MRNILAHTHEVDKILHEEPGFLIIPDMKWDLVTIGALYLVALALCATDIDALVANPLGQPIGTLTANVLGTKAGIALLAINFFSQFGCGVAFVRSSLSPSLLAPERN